MNTWKRSVIGCVMGNVLEWYDFILYGYFSQFFAMHFFPTQNRFVSLLMTFGVFATGCVMRPVGSMLFGHLGDKWGRKKALIASIVLITFSTTAMGCLPTVAQVGVLAPLLLVACRLLQGLAVSGEQMGAAVFLIENAPIRYHGFAGSLILGSVYVGLLVGSLIALGVTSFLSQAQLISWGWRAPFLLSCLLGVFGLWLRVREGDSASFAHLKAKAQVVASPVAEVLTVHWEALIKTIGLAAVLAVSIYLFVVYLPSYFTEVLHLTLHATLLCSSISLALVSVLVPIIGKLSDYTGQRFFLFTGCVSLAVFAYPIFALLSTQQLTSALMAECLLMIGLAQVAGALLPLLVHAFPANVRYTGACIGFNVSMTLFGSTAPLIALLLVKWTGSLLAPFWYLFGAALLSLLMLPLLGLPHVEYIDETYGDVELVI